MSLKAKIEAVIYAAEEPVTLAQLAALFQNDVLETRETRLAVLAVSEDLASPPPAPEADEEAPSLALEAGEVTVVLTSELGSDPGSELEVVAEEVAAELEAAAPETSELETLGVEVPEPSAPDAEPPVVESSLEDEKRAAERAIEDEKRAARQRDRDVRDELRAILDGLIAEYAESDRGMEIREIAGGYRVATKPEYHDAVRGFVKSLKPPLKLSLQALETLAVIAYKQPVTAPEVSEIRGVDSGGVLGSLVSRKLITTAGRKQVIGRPILYKTTKEFLLRFGLKDLNELPSIEEFEKMAGELAEPDQVAEADGEPEIARPELPFEPNADDLAEEPELSSGEPVDGEPVDEEQVDEEALAAAVDTIQVHGKGGADGDADLPGVKVEAEVKPADLVDAGEATSAVGQPGEGD
ncbi:segregation and condensation protein B [Silvibacterium bohemicum]|uniref:Segregation and condensation protein B n=1 Tax=Silvibacterium bohemicum TaxID=1577686 RepID=A0A841JZU0_9BACT|nr:SMC-Scp complex subunit ScpB [Silvibacterium bohemicum]MBB6146175.1 segregation and condensation protein B [Silvibacterium bohemicum]